MNWAAFFTLHSELPREGPGEAADIQWVGEHTQLPQGARILDAACGPGGDIPALLDLAPEAQVTAFDKHGPFVEAARAAHGAEDRVTLVEGDLKAPPGGPYDLIWCAGAVYFLGIGPALTAWRGLLAPGGVVAFSDPAFFTPTPTEGAQAFWGGDAARSEAEIGAEVAAAGWRTLATKRLSDGAWEAYYGPLDARMETLAGRPDLAEVLAEQRAEAAGWRRHRAETGYLLSIVEPL